LPGAARGREKHPDRCRRTNPHPRRLLFFSAEKRWKEACLLATRPVRSLVAAALVAAAAALGAAPARADQKFTVGYNQAWFHGDYGSDLTGRFDPIYVDLTFQKIALAGGSVVRIWLFEGEEKEGLVFTQATRTAGVKPEFLDNIETLCRLAGDHRLKIYFTVFDGNWFWAKGTHAANVHYNILNNRFGEGDSFEWHALGPVLDVLSRYQDVVFALDLMNEVEGSLAKWFWPDAWIGARKWIRKTAAFVKGRAPWLRVTASAGWATGASDLAGGFFDGLGLDFYDLHLYNDEGRIPFAFPLRVLSWRAGRQIVLGEFGQKAARVDDDLQRRVTAAFLANARRLGFAAALGWRFDDERPNDPSFVPSLSYLRNGQPRPAVDEMVKAAAAGGNTADPWW
jgi:hypothetical protein